MSKFFNPSWYAKMSFLLRERIVNAQQTHAVAKQLSSFVPMHTDARDFQTKRLSRMLQYAQQHCPYYHQILPKSPQPIIEHWQNVPLLDKSTIRQHFDSIVNQDLLRHNHHWKSTSGSEGDPLTFPASNLAADVDIAHLAWQYAQMGFQKHDKIAVLGNWAMFDKRDYEKQIYWETNPFRSAWHGQWHYFMAYLNDQTFDHYRAHLQATKPAFFNGHPSFVHRLAQYYLANNQKIGWQLKAIRLTGEHCHDWQAADIQRAFNVPIFLQYGHKEVAVYAVSRANESTYYCSPYYGITEVLDQNGKHVAVGEAGEIVVTGFFNFALPFIRYRTHDIAVFGGNYNGTVLLSQLLGRVPDKAINLDGEEIPAIFIGLPHHIRHKVTQWQATQSQNGLIDIALVPTPEWTKEDESVLRQSFLEKYRLKLVAVTYETALPAAQNGKTRFFVGRLLLS